MQLGLSRRSDTGGAVRLRASMMGGIRRRGHRGRTKVNLKATNAEKSSGRIREAVERARQDGPATSLRFHRRTSNLLILRRILTSGTNSTEPGRTSYKGLYRSFIMCSAGSGGAADAATPLTAARPEAPKIPMTEPSNLPASVPLPEDTDPAAVIARNLRRQVLLQSLVTGAEGCGACIVRRQDRTGWR